MQRAGKVLANMRAHGRRKNARRYNSRLAPKISHGSTLRRHLGMGLPELEAGFLSRKTRAGKVSAALFRSVERRRSELYFSPVVERNHRAKVDQRNASNVSLQRESASSHHTYQAP